MEEVPEIIDSKTVFEGRVFRVRTDQIRYDDGVVHRLDVVEHRGSFGIIALPSPNEIVLVRQYRHPIARSLWEIPAGTAELGEDPLHGAARELQEETGYRAGRVQAIGTMYMTPGFCNEIMHFFVAEELVAGEQSLDDDERIEVASFTLDGAEALVKAQEIADAKTLIALLWMRSGRGQLTP
jgi:ADP-ribose pyrophosphatase